jgi:RNA polymerase sigma-70 factor (ECF subfamily)
VRTPAICPQAAGADCYFFTTDPYMKLTKDDTKFEQMYFEYRDKLYWYVRKKVNTDEAAQDITSDVFVKLLENKDIFLSRDKNGVAAWLYTVARNMIIDSYRKKSNNLEKVGIEDDVFDLVAGEGGNNIDELIRDEKYQIVTAAMEGLDPIEREVITLRFNDELKFSEIAKVVNKEEGAVKMILYRALEKVKSKVGGAHGYELEVEGGAK